MKEKILFFHLLNNFTGSPQVLRNTIVVARDMGKDIHLFTSDTEGFLSGISGITYHRNFYTRSRFRVFTLFSFFFSQVLLSIRLLAFARDSCTFYVNTILPFSAILSGRSMGKEVIAHVHEYEISPRLLNQFLFWVLRSFASKILVVSNFLAKNPSLGGRECKVIYNSVKKELEQSDTFAVQVKKEFRVLMLASLRPYKGIFEFIELAKMLPEAKFDLILSDSEEEVTRWENEQDPPANLRILPVQQDVVPFYSSASLVVNLAHKDKWLETFGMTILEGMQFGLPAIVPSDGGVTELVHEGVNGFLVDYNELARIKTLIKRMQSDVNFWLDLSKNARMRAKLFTGEIFEKEIKQVLL